MMPVKYVEWKIAQLGTFHRYKEEDKVKAQQKHVNNNNRSRDTKKKMDKSNITFYKGETNGHSIECLDETTN